MWNTKRSDTVIRHIRNLRNLNASAIASSITTRHNTFTQLIETLFISIIYLYFITTVRLNNLKSLIQKHYYSMWPVVSYVKVTHSVESH